MMDEQNLFSISKSKRKRSGWKYVHTEEGWKCKRACCYREREREEKTEDCEKDLLELQDLLAQQTLLYIELSKIKEKLNVKYIEICSRNQYKK